MLLPNLPGCLVRYLRRSPKKIRLKSFIRTHCKELGKQVDTGYADVRRKPDTSSSPDNAHPVDADEVAIRDICRQDRVAPHIYELRYIDCDMLQSLPTPHRLASKIDGFGHGQDIDGAFQKIHAHIYPRTTKELNPAASDGPADLAFP